MAKGFFSKFGASETIEDEKECLSTKPITDDVMIPGKNAPDHDPWNPSNSEDDEPIFLDPVPEVPLPASQKEDKTESGKAADNSAFDVPLSPVDPMSGPLYGIHDWKAEHI